MSRKTNIKDKRLSVRVNKSFYNKLKRNARKNNLSISDYVRGILYAYIED